MNLLIGADPELFVRKNGKLASAWGLVEGTKENPFKVDNGAVQVDGMALEFNIDPADSAEMFVSNVQSVLAQLKDMVPEYEFDISPVAKFGKKMIDAQSEEAKILGCEPDYCAYTGKQNTPPNAQLPYRTASGHIHIGWTKDMNPHDPGHYQACMTLAKELDIYLALPSLLLEPPNNRRKLYGKAGCFRPKPYGMEYRTLSNFWLNSEADMKWIFNTVQKVFNQLVVGKAIHIYNKDISVDARYVIDNHSIDLLMEIVGDSRRQAKWNEMITVRDFSSQKRVREMYPNVV